MQKISEAFENLKNGTENFLDLTFSHLNFTFHEMNFESLKIPNDFEPKKVRGVSEILFESKKWKIENDFNLNRCSFDKLADIDEKTASAALKGFMPFSEDPNKQIRYINYLRYCLDKTCINNISLSSIYLDEREKEEFIMSARIFKRTSSLISARFESSSSNLQSQFQLKPGLTRLETSKRQFSDLESITHQNPEKSKFINANEHSSASGRKIFVWAPNNLLCKRFNAIPPENVISGKVVESKTVKPILSDESVEKLVSIIMEDTKRKIEVDPEEKNSRTIDEYLAFLPPLDLFDEIFGQKNS